MARNYGALAAAGGPPLREAWEALGIRQTALAEAVGVTSPALYVWARPGGRPPASRVAALAAALRRLAEEQAAARAEVLALVTAAAAAGEGLTVTELRRSRGRRAETDELLAALLRDKAVHVRAVVRPGGRGRAYRREELHPGPEPGEEEDPRELTPATLRGLRLYTGRQVEAMARRFGCRRQQLTAWEAGREPVPAGRQQHVREVLAQLVAAVSLRERREQAGLPQAELARRAGLAGPLLSRAETGRGRPLHWAELARVGEQLARAEHEAGHNLDRAVAELVALVRAHEPRGLTAAQLERARSRGRAGGMTGAAAWDARVLQAALERRELAWLETDVLSTHGRYRTARRLRLATAPHALYTPLSGAELAAELKRRGLSGSALARELGVSWGTVARWLRGERRIPPPRAEAVRRALDTAPVKPARRPVEDVRRAAHARPGLPPWRLLQAAGYGKSNATAAAALEQLLAAGELHLRPRPRASTVVMPGPAAGPAPAPLPGPQLRTRRQAARLRQQDIAAALGVTQTAVGLWERTAVPAARRAAVEQLLTA